VAKEERDWGSPLDSTHLKVKEGGSWEELSGEGTEEGRGVGFATKQCRGLLGRLYNQRKGRYTKEGESVEKKATVYQRREKARLNSETHNIKRKTILLSKEGTGKNCPRKKSRGYFSTRSLSVGGLSVVAQEKEGEGGEIPLFRRVKEVREFKTGTIR